MSTTGMGDSLWGTPALRALKKSFPDADIHFLVNSHWQKLFVGNPNIDRIINYSPKWFKQPLIGWKLLRYRYDRVLIFHANKDFTRLLPWLRYRSLIAHQTSAWIPEKNRVQIEGLVHGIQRRLILISKIGAILDGGQMEIFFNEAERKDAKAFLDKKSLSPKNYIYINIGASGAHRRWPENRFLALAEKILQQTNYKIILGGGPGEKQHIHDMMENLDPDRCSDSTGIPLKPDSYLISQARLLITCDTGPMHVGFALKVPTVALFGPYDPRGTGPFDLEKNSCFMIHPTAQGEFSSETNYEDGDLKKIDVAVVWDKVQEALAYSPVQLPPMGESSNF
ncbi:MAG: glycosyltransferase family 9 protein [Nitrospinae bacterium]|nr:glycosyltransferase family 9 protein [Nitrospinota bacterium]